MSSRGKEKTVTVLSNHTVSRISLSALVNTVNLISIDWEFIIRDQGSDTRKLLVSADDYPRAQGYDRFQVSLYNTRGLGEAIEAEKVDPFYKRWWFLVIVAMGALIIIITILAVLCCYCFRMKGTSANSFSLTHISFRYL